MRRRRDAWCTTPPSLILACLKQQRADALRSQAEHPPRAHVARSRPRAPLAALYCPEWRRVVCSCCACDSLPRGLAFCVDIIIVCETWDPEAVTISRVSIDIIGINLGGCRLLQLLKLLPKLCYIRFWLCWLMVSSRWIPVINPSDTSARYSA